VRVPVKNVVGKVNGGWPLIRAALAHERGTLWAFDFKIRLQNGSLALADMYRRALKGAASRGGDLATLRGQVAQAYIESEVFAAHTLRILPKANHYQWEAKTGSNAEMASLQRFVPEYFKTIEDWLAKRVRGFGAVPAR